MAKASDLRNVFYPTETESMSDGNADVLLGSIEDMLTPGEAKVSAAQETHEL